MKLKPQAERKAAIRRGECIADGCTRPLHGFGYCRKCLDEINAALLQAQRDAFEAFNRGSTS